MVIAGGASTGSAAGTYKIELDNAFGLVTGADFKVAGVDAGTIKSIDLDQKTLHAVVTVQVTHSGLRPVPHRCVLPVAAAVADRRVLHRVQPGPDGKGAEAG